jgi:DNA-binding transcriptional regulator YiaG
VTDADRPILFMEEAPADDFCASTEGGRPLSAWWYIYLSSEHSDSIRIRYVSPVLQTEAASDFRTSVDDLEEVSLTFSLTTTELAKILGVSRQIIYAWRRGEKHLSQASIRQRLSVLTEAARFWRTLSDTPVGEGREHRDAESKLTLLDLLQAKTLDFDALKSFLVRLDRHLREFWKESDEAIARIEAKGWEPIPDHLRDRSVHDRSWPDPVESPDTLKTPCLINTPARSEAAPR